MQLTSAQQRPLTGCLIAAPVPPPGFAGPVLTPFAVAAVLVRIGELAYDGAADVSRRSERPLFAELAATVRPLVRVLAALRKR